MSRVDHWLLVGATVAGAAALASGLGGTDLWPPDEPRVAEIAREMAATRRWLVPTLNGKPFLEEPPLFYWFQVVSYWIAGGASGVSARVPAALAGIAGVAATGALAASVGADPWIAALVLATFPEYWWMSRTATPDTAACAATALALLCFFVAWRAGRRALLAGTVAGIVAAFGCKSFLPVGLGVVAIGTFVAVAGRGRVRIADGLLAAAAVAAITGAWVWWLAHAVGGGAARFFVVGNHVGRFFGHADVGHARSVLYYPMNLALDLFPWSIVLPAAVVGAWTHRASPERHFPLVAAGAMLAVLTISEAKRAHYLLPAYPAFALLVAQWWSEAWHGRFDRTVRRLMLASLLAVGPVLAFLSFGVHAEDVRGKIVDVLAAARHATPAPASAVAAAAFLAGSFFVLQGERNGKPTRTVAALAGYVTGVHLLLSLVVFPRLNPLASPRPDAERLGRLANRGVHVMAFGTDDGTALSPILFYAGHEVPKIETVGTLVAHWQAGAACALIRTTDYAELAPKLSAPPVPTHLLPGSRFALVESAPGLCTTDPDPHRGPSS